MTEFDFDELDKAVNSLMGGMKAAKISDGSDPAKTLTINATLAPNETPEYNKLGEAAQKIGSEALDPTAINKTELNSTLAPGELPSYEKINAAARRIGNETIEDARGQASVKRSGRFMDVMHPSSDMKTASVSSGDSSPALSVPPRQPQATATPIASASPLTAAAEEQFSPEAVLSDTATPELRSDSAPTKAPEVAIPQTSVNPSVPVAVEASAVVDASPVISQKSMPEEATDPIVSPFLTDAKVEKRPLGGTNTSEEATGGAQEVATWPDASKDGGEDMQLNPSTGEASIIPDEFNNDLLAIETTQLKSTEVIPAPQVTSPSAKNTQKASSSDVVENTGAIYDVKEYHAPLKHPAKKSSGWLWIIITIVIMAVCGGIGAATYLLLK